MQSFVKIKTMTTIEGNKLIAEFMNDGNGSLIWMSDGAGGKTSYDNSWDWLMPVVKKIENTGRFQVEIELYSCYVIESNSILDAGKFCVESHEDSKINAVWQAVVQFIQWYNTQTTTPSLPGDNNKK